MLEKVLEECDQDGFAQITHQGGKSGKATIDLFRDEKIPVPATVEQLKEAILEVLPHARLVDVLIEVDDWVGLQSHFTHLNDRVGGSSTESQGSQGSSQRGSGREVRRVLLDERCWLDVMAADRTWRSPGEALKVGTVGR